METLLFHDCQSKKKEVIGIKFKKILIWLNRKKYQSREFVNSLKPKCLALLKGMVISQARMKALMFN